MRLLISLLLAGCTSPSTPAPAHSSCGHAHNDQENERPLQQALELGFCSVEVDVHLVGEQLLVGHDPEDLDPAKTLEAMYLAPLVGSTRAIILLVDVKTEAESTWSAIDRALASHDLGMVQVVISGGEARDAIRNATPRRASLDGRIVDLDAGVDAALFPLISDKWTDHFTWVGGVEPQPAEQRIALKALVERAHAAGHKIRFWQTGDRTEVWQAQVDAGVDLIGTDDLAGLAGFLNR
jgi:glycerophosphoryl diester phosphodiesterase